MNRIPLSIIYKFIFPVLFILCVGRTTAQVSASKIESVGIFKIAKTTTAIIDTLKKKYAIPATAITELHVDTNSTDMYYFLPYTHIFYIKQGIKVNNIPLSNVHLFFYNDTLIKMDADYSLVLENYLRDRYLPEDTTYEFEPKLCSPIVGAGAYLNLTGYSMTTWKSPSIYIESYRGLESNPVNCRIEEYSYFTMYMPVFYDTLQTLSKKGVLQIGLNRLDRIDRIREQLIK